jgi:hypothetical protein
MLIVRQETSFDQESPGSGGQRHRALQSAISSL